MRAPSSSEGAVRRPITPRSSSSLRLSPEVLDHFKAAGPGWQTRINEVLLKSVRAKRAGAR